MVQPAGHYVITGGDTVGPLIVSTMKNDNGPYIRRTLYGLECWHHSSEKESGPEDRTLGNSQVLQLANIDESNESLYDPDLLMHIFFNWAFEQLLNIIDLNNKMVENNNKILQQTKH